jgi:hypothetical protein
LKGLDFSEGARVQKLDLVNNPDRVGDVTGAFEPAEPFKPLPPDPREVTYVGVTSGWAIELRLGSISFRLA